MTPFRDWLTRVLEAGESVQSGPPTLEAGERAGVVALLADAFGRHAIGVAGPPLAFDADAALGAAQVLAAACWRLLGGEGDEVYLDVGVEPSTPAAQLSADLTLRLLPAVRRRALARSGAEALVAKLDGLLRRWPLSGVLADLDGGPVSLTEFGGHPGLQLLYAERLVVTGRPGWVPAGGAARGWAGRVFHERGRPLPAVPQEAVPGD